MALPSIYSKYKTCDKKRNGNFSRLAHFLLFSFLLFFSSFSATRAQINTDNVIIMGRTALGMDDYITAIHYFNQVIEAKPYLYDPYYFRAYAKFSLEDYVGAESDCNKSLELNPYMVEVYLLRGLCRIHNENFKGAIDDYTKALKEEPDDHGAIYNRALCRMEMKDFEQADKEIDYLLSKSKDFQRAYMIKAQIAMERKDTLAGVQWVDSLIHINPNEEQAWSFKGRYALSKEQFQLADSCLSRAIYLRPTNFDNYVARAQARHGLNRFALALKDYDKTIELIPEHFVAHYNRGLLRALVGDNNRAIEDFDFVLKIEPDNTLAIYNRALLRETTGNYRGAIEDYTKLIQTYPNFTYGYMARANCRRKVGDIRGAKNDETEVARAHLDMNYKPKQRKPIKKVRLRSEHSLEQYQQLVEEAPDTTNRFINQLIGKVQNKQVKKEILHIFAFNFRQPKTKYTFQNSGFLPEVDRINKKGYVQLPLSFEATNERKFGIADLELAKEDLDRNTLYNADKQLLYSIVYAGCYNFDDALKAIDDAIRLDSTNYIYPLQRAALLISEQISKETTALAAENKTANKADATMLKPAQPSLFAMAMAELNKADHLSPNNPYVLYNRGCLHAMLKQNEAAIKDFSEAIRLDKHLAEAYYNRAVIYLHQGEVKKAIPDLSYAGQNGLYQAYSLLKQASQMK